MEEEGSGTVGLSDETKRTCSGKKKWKMENGKIRLRKRIVIFPSVMGIYIFELIQHCIRKNKAKI